MLDSGYSGEVIIVISRFACFSPRLCTTNELIVSPERESRLAELFFLRKGSPAEIRKELPIWLSGEKCVKISKGSSELKVNSSNSLPEMFVSMTVF